MYLYVHEVAHNPAQLDSPTSLSPPALLKSQSAPANMVVVASGVEAAAPLADELAQAGVEVHIVGDADEVDYIEGAIHSAWKVATAI